MIDPSKQVSVEDRQAFFLSKTKEESSIVGAGTTIAQGVKNGVKGIANIKNTFNEFVNNNASAGTDNSKGIVRLGQSCLEIKAEKHAIISK